MTRWRPEFCDMLAARGFYVVRYDNRDVGLSEKIDTAGVPDMPAIMSAVLSGKPAWVPYNLADMAADGIGLLDALKIERAHIVGASMGGMIAQLIAADYPDRTLSLTSIMSSTGNPDLPRPAPEVMAVVTSRGQDARQDREGYIARSIANARIVGSPAYVEDEVALRTRLISDLDRNYCPEGFARQYAAVLASPDRRPKLKTIRVPTVVVHGEADPLVPVAAARDTAKNIPNAELRVIPGMGHDLPQQLSSAFIDAIESVALRARAST